MTSRPTRAVGLLCVAAAVATAATACSSAAGATKSGAEKSTTKTIVWIATDEDGNMATADLGAKSAEGAQDITDIVAFTQSLATEDGKKVGEIHVAGVGASHTTNLGQATATIVLADGTIEVAGVVPRDPAFTLAVVGGTGAYTGETGTLDLDFSGDAQRLTAHLQG